MTSCPLWTEIRFTAVAMLATATRRNPSATRSGVSSAAGTVPVSAEIRAASPAKSLRGVSTSSGWSPSGPKVGGKCSGRIRPSTTLASVTVSGPPPR